MRVLVTGGRGFIGSALVARLKADGFEPVCLTRHARLADEIAWDPAAGRIDAARLESFDAVVHLAGEPIAGRRWNLSVKEGIRSSRIDATRLLLRNLAACHRPPGVFLSASAVGFYGDRGDELLAEESAVGRGFLAAVCRDWEVEAARAGQLFGARVVALRFGAVLGAGGGMLGRLFPIFRLGLGGRLGSGRQWLSWIALGDAVSAIRFLMESNALAGPVNLTSPGAVTNAGFTRALARTVRRPAFCAVPAFALRAALGGMADDLLLASACVRPAALERAGFHFEDPTIEACLRRIGVRHTL